jgi:hypothetical protein
MKKLAFLLLLLLSVGAHAAITHVASVSAQGNSVTVNTTGAIDTTGANLCVATISSNLGASSFTSVTDSNANTWSTAVDWTANGGDFIRIMYPQPRRPYLRSD